MVEFRLEQVMIRILLVEEQESIRLGLRMHFALEPDLLVVGEASDGPEALQFAQELQPDVILMGIQLPRLDGLSVAEKLIASQPNCAVIILTLHDEPVNRERAKQIGVAAFISKEKPDGALIDTLRDCALKHRGLHA
jgi:DNA-binding NarL/FixJ family response regulator